MITQKNTSPSLNAFPRRVLLAVSGMSPQIVTETLYGLCVAASDPFHVNEIRLVTTSSGARQAELSLLREGRFHQMCAEYGLDNIKFGPEDIEIIRGASGTPLDDIRSPEENVAAADFITETLRRLTADERSALHVSLAGGRKTMGYYMGYALSLLGRSQDRLSHVLVSQGFETHPEFFYPTRNSRVISDGKNRYMDASEAKVTLAEIPFVLLRNKLPDQLLETRTSFSELVRWSNLDAQPLKLEFYVPGRAVYASGERIPLNVKEFAFYLVFARSSKQENEDERCFEAGDCPNPILTRAYAEELCRCAGLEIDESLLTRDLLKLLCQSEVEGLGQRTLESIIDGIGRKYIQPIISNIKTKLVVALGESLADCYRISKCSSIKDGGSDIPLYGLSLTPDQIKIIDNSEHAVANHE